MWNWNILDEDTRYILASHLSKERNMKATETVMKKAVAATAVEPRPSRPTGSATTPTPSTLYSPTQSTFKATALGLR